MQYHLRTASDADVPVLHALIRRSIHGLGTGDYTPAQIEAALTGAFGVDTALIRDGTYFVIEGAGGEIAACGGWSHRRTLFGSDNRAGRDEGSLDPATEPAKIRAFFVDPAHARRGLGRMLLERSEADARRAGFRALELMATLPGQRLYREYGFVAMGEVDHPLPGGLTIRFVPMRKEIGGADVPPRGA
ncbi:MAG: GNAT family N-acetyltransferase [Proteobacteria bacterium]|nr:GNAT family N-acetyltransferase [Pseudomonadota bacterium]